MTRMRQNEEFKNSDELDEGPSPLKKKRKLVEVQSLDDTSTHMILPMIESIMNRSFPFKAKIACLTAIVEIISEDLNACKYLAKKDVIDEIANIADKIIFKVGIQPDKDLDILAKILVKVSGTSTEGKKLIQEMKMPISSLERLKKEMKKFEMDSNPEQFAFDSDHIKKVKNEIDDL